MFAVRRRRGKHVTTALQLTARQCGSHSPDLNPARHSAYASMPRQELPAPRNRGGAMSGKKKAKPDARAELPPAVEPAPAAGKLKWKDYQRELAMLHAELVKLQIWAIEKGLKVCIVFEGRDGAGKGGAIKAITERVSPRVFRVVALPAPTDREKSQLYAQRYIQHLPAAGEIVIFDRSWYNRAGVERVMGFCSEDQAKRFLDIVPGLERAIIDSGTILLKYWMEVSEEEQTRRLGDRINDGRKIWKLSPMDLKSYSRWYDYSRARDAMFAATDTPWAPWYVVRSDDKRRARLNVISHLLRHVPYQEIARKKVKLPDRQKPQSYVEPDYPYKYVTELAWPGGET
jgi:polyphosphate kinase 2